MTDDKQALYRKRWRNKMYKERPWLRFYYYIKARCYGMKNRRYYKQGIKNYLSVNDLEHLWKRDKAYNLKKPSIDRIDSTKHYTLDNCRFIEKWENVRRKWAFTKIIQVTKEGIAVRVWNNAPEAAYKFGINPNNIYHVIEGRRPTAGGYKWMRA